MLLYTTLGTDDLPRAIAFYDAVMAALGHARLPDWSDGWAGWGQDYDTGFGFWLCRPFDEKPATAGNGTMLAFKADSPAQVRAFHAVGMSHGGADEGSPGLRPHYAPTFYAAYLRDPDGHKLAAVFHRYSAAEDTQATR
ncbi:VOC family protein [Segnochrobactrum spirostomi]|uniref:VOC family protein n=1 Tax=Segnochrobactrum spirostomi TaxID=2608987 RepID=A0A6A7XY18_9HYPH|nr:VOC family protein [Segnochrobactrum spirostomi]MQT11325.1 VOC family protein [Segnochrobactrum spirostomi]